MITYLLARILQIHIGNKQVNLPAPDKPADLRSNLRLIWIKHPRHLHGKIQKTIVHRLHFHRDPAAALDGLPPAKAGHTANHACFPPAALTRVFKLPFIIIFTAESVKEPGIVPNEFSLFGTISPAAPRRCLESFAQFL